MWSALLCAVFAVVVASVVSCRSRFPGVVGSGGATVPRRIGLVIAHPDDEVMFFSPALLELRAAGHALSVLCLSTGNADGLGRVRSKELAASVRTLVGPSARVHLIDDETNLADGFKHTWCAEVVKRHVATFVKEERLDTLLTFDDYGISGHPNHIDTFKGVQAFLVDQHPPPSGRAHAADASAKSVPLETPPVVGYSLLSTPIYRKYLGLLDAVYSRFEAYSAESDSTPSSSPPSYAHPSFFLFFSFRVDLVYRCMSLHASQFVWYRRLFILFSRYTCINSIRRITTETND